MFKSIFQKLLRFPYLVLTLSYCLSFVIMFFYNIGSLGSSKIETINNQKIIFDLNNVFVTVSAIVIANFGLSLYMEKLNNKYNQLFFLVNCFFMIFFYFILLLSVF